MQEPGETQSAGQMAIVVAASGLLVLGAAGLVLALSWALALPSWVLVTALAVALAAALAVLVGTFVDARNHGDGVLRALGRALLSVGRFILWFF